MSGVNARAEVSRALGLALLLSFGPTVSNSFARFAYGLVLPAMRGELELTYAQAGWLNTANAFGYLGGAVLTVLLVTRYGSRLLFVVGMAITAIAVLTTGLSHDLSLLTLARIVSGVGGAMAMIGGGALAGNVIPGRPDLATMTILVYFGGAGLGLMACGVAIPFYLDAAGPTAWPMVWHVMGLTSVAMAAASIWAAARIQEPQRAAGSATWQPREFAPQIASYMCFGTGYIGYMTFVVAWMRDNGSGTASVAAVWFVLGLTTLIAPLVWTRPCHRWMGGRPLAAILGVLAAGAAIPLFTVGVVPMLVSAALFGVAVFSAPSAIGAFLRKALPKPAWGGAIAAFTVVFAISQIIGPIATGWLADHFGSLRPGLAASACVLVVGSLVALGQPDRRADVA